MRFTVVTPSFGQLEWLDLCIASVADQVAPGGVEHIVCDGGTQGMESFLRRQHERHADREGYRLRFEVGPDAGMYDAINKGLRLAGGQVLSYLNCDEQLLPGALHEVAAFFDARPEADVVFGDTVVVDAQGMALCYWRPYVPTAAHLAGSTLNTLSCSTFFRRRVLEAGHYFDPEWKAVGDLLWVRGLIEAGRTMACVPRPLGAFTFLGDNLGASARAEEEFRRSRGGGRCGGLAGLVRRMLHAGRKAGSGAYVRRNLTYDLFALPDATRRRRFSAAAVGWTWPRARRPGP